MIDVGALDTGGKPFKLSGDLGGYANRADYAQVVAAFQNAKGDTLGKGVIGRVTAAQRGNVSSLVHQAWYGSVPAGTVRVVVTIATVGVSSAADNMSLTIGSSAEPSGPVLRTMPYASVGDVTGTHVDPGTGAVLPNATAGSLYHPGGLSVGGGSGHASADGASAAAELRGADDSSVYVSNTGDNVVAELRGGDTSIVAGSFEGYGEGRPRQG
ncbi:hypothetical protein [Streptomyces sp. NPDC008139]|uniref:hypothetical protein n=1 Tax=Streptomyces sp. NPDC008139 TaxID=3364814 RepID=UPI0036EF17DB